MAQTLVCLRVHVVFSTKDRRPMITPEVEPELYAYLAGTAKNLDSPCLAAGGTSNHVHLLISQSKNIALSHLMEEIKKSSSKWIKTKGADACGVSAGRMAMARSQSASRRWRP